MHAQEKKMDVEEADAAPFDERDASEHEADSDTTSSDVMWYSNAGEAHEVKDAGE